MALKQATDREQILKALFSGYGTLGNDHPIPPTDPVFQQGTAAAQVRSGQGRAAFKKAGIADPKIVLQASDAAFNGAVDEGALLQASAAKAGIKVDLKKEPADGFWDNVWLKGAFVSSYWGGRAAATQMLSVAFGGKRALERDALEQREVREAARRRARRDGRGQAQAIHLGNAGDAERAGRRDHSGLQGLARRAQRQGRRPYAARRLRHGQRPHHGEGLDQNLADCGRARSVGRGAARRQSKREPKALGQRGASGEAGLGVSTTVAREVPASK